LKKIVFNVLEGALSYEIVKKKHAGSPLYTDQKKKKKKESQWAVQL